MPWIEMFVKKKPACRGRIRLTELIRYREGTYCAYPIRHAEPRPKNQIPFSCLLFNLNRGGKRLVAGQQKQIEGASLDPTYQSGILHTNTFHSYHPFSFSQEPGMVRRPWQEPISNKGKNDGNSTLYQEDIAPLSVGSAQQ
jgi:hypothetical protein